MEKKASKKLPTKKEGAAGKTEGEVKNHFSFCESIHATSLSKWHIRRLTDEGPKHGGGIDTDSLCGRVEKGRGWDLEVKPGNKELMGQTDKWPFVCKECLQRYVENM